jgi:hypothetical protein
MGHSITRILHDTRLTHDTGKTGSIIQTGEKNEHDILGSHYAAA